MRQAAMGPSRSVDYDVDYEGESEGCSIGDYIDHHRAVKFERYLKSGSGCRFATTFAR